MKNRFPFLALACALILSAPAFAANHTSANPKNNVSAYTEEQVGQISFGEGRTTLTQAEREEIDQLVTKFKTSDRIDEIKVLAWADREYPVQGEKASKADITLAKKRSEAVKDYLKKVHKISDVDTYNMAERPNSMQKLFETGSYEVKTSAEVSGAAPTSDRLNLMKTNAHSGKALLLVNLKQAE